jgi:hypothetical protein
MAASRDGVTSACFSPNKVLYNVRDGWKYIFDPSNVTAAVKYGGAFGKLGGLRWALGTR